MEENQQSTPPPPVAQPNFTDEVKHFYKGDFKKIFSSVFKDPTNGAYSIFQNPGSNAASHSLILYGSVFVFFALGIYLLAGDYRSYIKFKQVAELSSVPVTFMFFISIITFGLKSISSKPIFKNELLTGGICGIPIAMLIPGTLIVKLWVGGNANIFSLLEDLKDAGFIGGFLLLYIFIMLINIVMQSLRASGSKESFSFYLSPLCVLLSGFLAFKVLDEFF